MFDGKGEGWKEKREKRIGKYEHVSIAACQNLRFKCEPQPTCTHMVMHPCGEVGVGAILSMATTTTETAPSCDVETTPKRKSVPSTTPGSMIPLP